MIVCRCGKKFRTACLHANHKIAEVCRQATIGRIDDHKSVCSSCRAELDFQNMRAHQLIENPFGAYRAALCPKCAGNKTFRWWEHLNGDWIRLTLRPGGRLQWGEGGRHDEGWTYSIHTWEWPAGEDKILQTITTESRDCDGRMSKRGDYYFDPINGTYTACFMGWDRNHKELWSDTMDRPDWEVLNECQRDHSAEAMGY